MIWVDYKKAYDMVHPSWIIATMRMVGLADNIIGLIKQSLKKWKTNLYADGELLALVPIRRVIFQGNLFSTLLFVIALLPLTHILRKAGMEHQLEKNGAKVTHLFFIDDLNLYGKNDKEINSLIKTVWQCCEDIKIGIWYLKMCHSIAAKNKEIKMAKSSTTEWRGNR